MQQNGINARGLNCHGRVPRLADMPAMRVGGVERMMIAKASPADIERAIGLLQLLEATIPSNPWRSAFFPEDEAPLDDDNKADLRRFYDECSKLSAGLGRIIWGYQVLLDNCCDPNSTVLDWKPEIKAKMDADVVGKENTNE